MADLKIKFGKKFGIIKVVFGTPTVAGITVGLQKVEETFKTWKWELRRMGNGYLAKFPSEFSLDRAKKFRVMKCRGESFGLCFKRYIFPDVFSTDPPGWDANPSLAKVLRRSSLNLTLPLTSTHNP